VQQQALVNRKGSILLHDNTKPHVASTTAQKLHRLGIEVLSHFPYSSDFHLTISLLKNDLGRRRILKTPFSSIGHYGNYFK
ncbi:Histone-lysine N-methyltransferase SETMAR, partial [Habropoda laboriosa]